MPDIRLTNIVVDPSVQPRARSLDQGHVDEIAEAVKRGDDIPRVILYETAEGMLLSEGFHRVEGHRRAGRTHIPAEVRQGTRLDAILNAMGSNQGHGLKRTNADKRRAAAEVLKACPKWTDAAIAKHVGITDKTVADVRAELVRRSEIPNVDTRTDSKGREQPATKPKPKSAPDKEVTAEPVSQPESEPVGDTVQKDKDEDEDDITVIGDDLPETVVREKDPLLPHEPAKSPYGERPPLPGADEFQTRYDQSAKEAVAQRKLFLSLRKHVREVIEGLDSVSTKPSAAFLRNLEYGDHQPILKPVSYRHNNRQQTINTFAPLFDLLRALTFATPKKVCDGCRGHGCGSCRHAGFIPAGDLQKPEEAGIPFVLGGDPWDEEE